MKKLIILWMMILVCNLCFSQVGPQRSYRPIQGNSYTQSKNVYLFTLMEELPEVKALLEADPDLSSIANAKIQSLENSLEACGNEGTCYPKAVIFTPNEIDQIAGRLEKLAEENPQMISLVENHLIPSGMYQMQADEDLGKYLANAFKLDAATINHMIAVYGMGEKPNYPNIDSLGVAKDSYYFIDNNKALNLLNLDKYKDSHLFFELPMHHGLDLMEIARMSRAGDFEPMVELENRAAYFQAQKTNWEEYPYPLILIPGAGTDNYLDSLSAGGVIRAMLALRQYEQSVAPFIAVSGGYVHPYKVQHAEAIEMKRYLMRMGVPESAIIIDPHARHTTTNMRNVARMMFRYGFPMDRPSVTVTGPAQSKFIEGMLDRCMKELGYHTYTNGKRISQTMLEFYPQIMSLQIDWDEPLDP